MENKKNLSQEQRVELITALKSRFEKNMKRHPGIDWVEVEARLKANPGKLWSLHQMEASGGDPDVVALDTVTGEYVIYDCTPETPQFRRNLCYDRAALEARKKFKPKGSALDLAEEMGIEILTSDQYLHLQSLGEFDFKTSSWLKTPGEIRNLGGALFGDRRYGNVFIYHNGAQSYYAVRGFRGSLRI